jgi:hypothetical protein
MQSMRFQVELDMRDVVTFTTDLFNLTEQKDYFINPNCYGDDLARWLAGKLKAKGISVVGEPEQEDFGWYVRYMMNGVAYCAVIGNKESKSWYVVIELVRGLFSSMLGQRHKNISAAAIEAIDAALREEPRITDVLWFHWGQFRKGIPQENGTRTPYD